MPWCKKIELQKNEGQNKANKNIYGVMKVALRPHIWCVKVHKGIVTQYNLKTKMNFCRTVVISMEEKSIKIHSTQENECKGLFGSYQLKPMSKECFPYHY